jgi:alkanesulfonate monooxygenase SsuD/methylene tetrahydromethanopterin reductase-like flavin-dependent oxidoreductase (luciferase family)
MSARDRLTGPSNTGVWYFTDAMGRDPFATGIASIFHRHPGPMLQAANTLAEQTGGRFVDHVVVWSDTDTVRAGIQAHYDTGADHVCIQPVSTDGPFVLDWNALEALAPTA